MKYGIESHVIKTGLIFLMLAFGIGHQALAGNAAPADTYEKLLKTTDIEKVTGLKDVRPMAKDPAKGASGMVNFSDAQGAFLFAATYELIDAANLSKTKSSSTWKNMINAPVKGVGDEAFSAPKGASQFILIFKKGKNWITLSSGFNPANMKPKMSMEQIKAIAKIIVSRL